jgi:hypothetical protein
VSACSIFLAVVRALRTGQHCAAIVATKFPYAKVMMNASGVEIAGRNG